MQFGIKASIKYKGQMEQEDVQAKNHQQLEPKLLDLIVFLEEEMVLANDLLVSRETLKNYKDKYNRSSKKRLMKSYADILFRNQILRKKLSISGKATVTFVVESVTWTTDRLLKREIRHWQKGSYGCYKPIRAHHNA